jgi:hypothetical protein
MYELFAHEQGRPASRRTLGRGAYVDGNRLG